MLRTSCAQWLLLTIGRDARPLYLGNQPIARDVEGGCVLAQHSWNEVSVLLSQGLRSPGALDLTRGRSPNREALVLHRTETCGHCSQDFRPVSRRSPTQSAARLATWGPRPSSN